MEALNLDSSPLWGETQCWWHVCYAASYRPSDFARSDTTSLSRTRLHGLCFLFCIYIPFILHWWKKMQYIAKMYSQDTAVDFPLSDT